MPTPMMLGIGLIALGFCLSVYIVIATIRDRRHVRPIKNSEDD